MQTWLTMSTLDKTVTMVLLVIGVAVFLVILGLFARAFNLEKISRDGIQFGKGGKESNREKGNSSNVSKRPTLLKHRFFQLMDIIKMDGYIRCETPNEDKKIINVTFLQKCLFYVVNKGIKDFFKEMEATNGETLYMLPSTILKLMAEYTEKARTIKLTLKDGTVLYGIPDCYISRFNAWNYEHNQVLMESIQDVISDEFYTDWYMKCVACLDYLYNCYALTVYDANRTLGQLNGNLEAEIASLKNGSCCIADDNNNNGNSNNSSSNNNIENQMNKDGIDE